jgi:hypothetical protein
MRQGTLVLSRRVATPAIGLQLHRSKLFHAWLLRLEITVPRQRRRVRSLYLPMIVTRSRVKLRPGDRGWQLRRCRFPTPYCQGVCGALIAP